MPAITDSFHRVHKLSVPLLTASVIILLAAAVAIPNLLRSPMPADEARRLHSLDQRYASARPGNLALTDVTPVSVPSRGMIAVQLKSTTPEAAKAESATTDRKIVRTSALELTVKSPADAAEQIRRMAENMGGYLESAQIGGTNAAPTADLTIRVPATQFEQAKAQIRKLAAHVESEKTAAEDITRQYVDREARLRNLRAEEAQYLTIMKSAFKIDDLLEVTQKLSEVRGQIEQQQAEFHTLSKQVETVAIAISMRTLADAQVFGLNWRPLYQLKVAARDGLDALADYATTMAAILFYVPVIFTWSLTILFTAVAGWRLLRWTGRRVFAWPAVAVPEKATSSM